MSGQGMPSKFAAPKDCAHEWEAVSMAFETQLLDPEGRVRIRQPDLAEGRVYFICRSCASHTYMTTQWLGARMYGSEDAIPSGADGESGAWSRGPWQPELDDSDIGEIMTGNRELIEEARNIASVGVQKDDGYTYSVPASDLLRNSILLRDLADALEVATSDMGGRP